MTFWFSMQWLGHRLLPAKLEIVLWVNLRFCWTSPISVEIGGNGRSLAITQGGCRTLYLLHWRRELGGVATCIHSPAASWQPHDCRLASFTIQTSFLIAFEAAAAKVWVWLGHETKRFLAITFRLMPNIKAIKANLISILSHTPSNAIAAIAATNKNRISIHSRLTNNAKAIAFDVFLPHNLASFINCITLLRAGKE
jgi:hypothetical protein